MGGFMKECGLEIKCMEKGNSFGQTGVDMKEIIIMIREKDMVFMIGELFLKKYKFFINIFNSLQCRPDGKRYLGIWKDGQQHGKGIMIFEDGTKNEGEWLYGKKIKD